LNDVRALSISTLNVGLVVIISLKSLLDKFTVELSGVSAKDEPEKDYAQKNNLQK